MNNLIEQVEMAINNGLITDDEKYRLIRLAAGNKPVMINIDLKGNCMIKNSFDEGGIICNNSLITSDE